MVLSAAMEEKTQCPDRARPGKMERKATLDLQRFLSEQNNEASPPTAAEDGLDVAGKDRPFRQSLEGVTEVTVALRDRFSTCHSVLARDEMVRTMLVRRILDLAAYWVGTVASCETSAV